jgi:alpha-tubulin suppressor-like RCC1 family protein
VNEVQTGEDYSIIILKNGKIYSTGANNVNILIFNSLKRMVN